MLEKWKSRFYIPVWIKIGIKVFITAWAIIGSPLTVVEWGSIGSVPLIKWFLTILQSFNNGGIVGIGVAICLAYLYYANRDDVLQRHLNITAFSILFSFGMVLGKSYKDLGSWDYIFHGSLQMGLAFCVMCGYYFLVKNIIIIVYRTSTEKKNWFRANTKNSVEEALFEKHTLGLAFLFFIIAGIPYLISFFPGTLAWDSFGQIRQALGAPGLNGWHPIVTTRLMGKCVYLGRILFHSDSIGLFLYAGPQYIFQCMVFAFGMKILCRMKTSVRFRWLTLLYFGLYPVWQNWGYTMVKDTLYYILIFLLVALLIHMAMDQMEEKVSPKWVKILFILTEIGIVLYRKEGKYVIAFTVVMAVLMNKKYWKIYVAALICSFLSVFLVDDVYMVKLNIEEGPIRESMSIPIQQTARYLKEYGAEVTESELQDLSTVFVGNPMKLAEVYNPEISDNTKALFMYSPTEDDLKVYYKVWWQQFTKHPDVYVQALLNQTYGYFYTDRENFWDNLGIFYIGNKQRWTDEYIDIGFAVENQGMRDTFREYTDIVSRMPFIGMFYNSGFQMYILLGCVLFILKGKRKSKLYILIPSIGVAAICFLSPVNAYLRYMLPIMAAMPLNIGWCSYTKSREN